ncbi:MAG: hypothetical protein HQL16_06775 [Candidatus Omnitrophica bacterium]|nr:hypothetical protein [Candidatus Omnitrophota bacterium]
MSKTIMQGLVVLLVLLLLSLGVVGFTLYKKQKVEEQNRYLQGQLDDEQGKVKNLTQKNQDLGTQVSNARAEIEKESREIDSAQKRSDDIQKKYDAISMDLDKVRLEKNDIDSRLQNIRTDRDALTKQLADLKAHPIEKIVEKIVYRDKPAEGAEGGEAGAPGADKDKANGSKIVIENKANEDYWAGIVREKAALQLELDKVKKDISTFQIKIAELTKANSDYEIELGRLKNEKEEISRKIKYGEDLADSLSIELARARNDQKMTADRADKVGQENLALRSEIKQLTTTKVALEKSIARLSDEKAGTEKKLVETESVIQNRIEEIWKIKKDIDGRFDARGYQSSSGEVELPPIVVNGGAAPSKAAATAPQVSRKTGTVVSINEDNNFVIIDVGEKAGIKAGDSFRVYRNGSVIGAIQVIQVRQDISAADIKQKSSVFKPGDTVK